MQLGQVISGKYRLLRLLGDGGMGAVYEANHEVLGAHVAIKVLHEDLAGKPELVDRFLREARVLAQISNRHVVRVLDIALPEAGAPPYIVMELLAGEALSVVVGRERRLPLAVAVEYAIQILDALGAAHALGVIHRDLKPENVLVLREADRALLKVIDFGIAKAGSAAGAASTLTVSGAMMGTPEYMAPEQAHSADRVDARSDVFAVGVMLYEMLSGARPVEGEDPRVVALKVERGEVQPLIHRVPELPRDLAGHVHRAMAPRPDLRFASATEMRVALEAVLNGLRQSRQLFGSGGGIVEASPGERERPRGTGTMFGEPAGEVAAARPQNVVTDPGTGASAPYDRAPLATVKGPARRPARGGGAVWLVGAVLVLVGGGIAVAFAFAGSTRPTASPSSSPASAGSLVVGPSTLPAASTTAPSSSDEPDLGPLPAPTLVPPAHPVANVPHGSASGSPRAIPSTQPVAEAPDSPFGIPTTFGFPSSLPTSFPNPFPSPASSGVGPVMTIPTSFAPFGLPPPPPSSSTSSPHHSSH